VHAGHQHDVARPLQAHDAEALGGVGLGGLGAARAALGDGQAPLEVAREALLALKGAAEPGGVGRGVERDAEGTGDARRRRRAVAFAGVEKGRAPLPLVLLLVLLVLLVLVLLLLVVEQR